MSKKKVILVTGDSLVEGIGDAAEGGWAFRLKKAIGKEFTFYIYSFGGQNVLDLQLRFEDELIKFQPNIVLIQIGLNDSRIRDSLGGENEVPAQKFNDIFSKIIRYGEKFFSVELIASIGLPIVDEKLTRPYKTDKHYINFEIEKFENIIQEACSKNKIPFITIGHRVKPDTNGSMLFDGVHPSSEGHQAIFEEVYSVLHRNQVT